MMASVNQTKQFGVVEESTQQNPVVVQAWVLAIGERLQALFAQAALEQRHITSVVGDQVLSVPTRHGTATHHSVAGILLLTQA